MSEKIETAGIDPVLIKRLKSTLFESPVARAMGIRLIAMSPGAAKISLPFSEQNVTEACIVHGGVIATVIDIAGVCAAATKANPQTLAGGATSNIAVSYLSAVEGCDITANATVLNAGRRNIVCHVQVENFDGKLVAQALVTVVLFQQ